MPSSNFTTIVAAGASRPVRTFASVKFMARMSASAATKAGNFSLSASAATGLTFFHTSAALASVAVTFSKAVVLPLRVISMRLAVKARMSNISLAR